MTKEQLKKAYEISEKIDYLEQLLENYKENSRFNGNEILVYLRDDENMNRTVNDMMKNKAEKELEDLKAEFEAL